MPKIHRRLITPLKKIARTIGDFQVSVLLLIFYFIILPPFALVVKVFSDPLGLKPKPEGSLWLQRENTPTDLLQAHQQF